jgi:hypothetical protein
MTKVCNGCGIEKPTTDYYRRNARKQKIQSRCKACTALYDAARRARIVEAERLRLRKRREEEVRTGKAKEKYALAVKRNPQHYAARYAVSTAIRCGKLVKAPCVECGEPKVQAHHLDYSKALDVVWLCMKHHRDLHRKYPVALGARTETTRHTPTT